MKRRPVIGVIGGGKETAPPGSHLYTLAEELGKEIATAGAILLCGGRDGVMEASAKGAKSAGGHTIGIMPSLDRSTTAPNQHIEHAVYTGMGNGRNFLNAAVSDVVIAMEGGPGTLSEVALALKEKDTQVVYLSAWGILINQKHIPTMPYVTTPQAAVDEAFKALRIQRNTKLDKPLKKPSVPDQSQNLSTLELVVAGW